MIPDAPKPPRPGEELDLAKLAPYLQAQLGAPDAEVSVLQFPGGHSNLTYLVTVGGKEYVLRRPPFGSKVKTAHDMGREVRVLSKLAPVFPKAPRPALYCEDTTILGAPFYLMQRLSGVILRRGATIDPDAARRTSTALIDGLVELHALDYQAIGLGDFGRPDGYVERQVTGWTKRYRDSQTDDIPEMESVAAWLAAHLPPSPPPTIVHNDYKYDNLIFDEGLQRIIGILDWEMATIGDPLMDLGTTLCYWVEAADPPEMQAISFGPTTAPGNLSRRELAERYAAATGRSIAHLTFYHAFGLFKTAVVTQQIYYRFAQGLTKDARFGAFIHGVRAMARQAAAMI